MIREVKWSLVVLLLQLGGSRGDDLLEPETECSGDLVWDGCHTACPLVCHEEMSEICPTYCHRGCGCPRGMWLTAKDGDSCVETEDECPNESVAGGDRDEHNCIHSAGYSWCGGLRKCIRPWELECDCLTAMDTNGHCVDAHCTKWFDGCNTCGVDMITGLLACTEMYCLVLEEPKCLAYSSDLDPSTLDEDSSSSSSSKSTKKAAAFSTVVVALVVAAVLIGIVAVRVLYHRGLCDERTPLKAQPVQKFTPIVELPTNTAPAKDKMNKPPASVDLA